MVDMDHTTAHNLPHGPKRTRRSPTDYTVACICPLAIESAPLRAMLDTIHEDLPANHNRCAYILGELEHHNVVIAILPSIGNNDSGAVATQLLNDFPSIDFALLVGVGAGVPGLHGKNDIRLGDVVVSESSNSTGGVIQFDRGKHHSDNRFEVMGHLNKTSPSLNAAIKKLKAQHYQEGNHIRDFVVDVLRRNPNMKHLYTRPSLMSDQLFQTAYTHQGGETCEACDATMVVERAAREGDEVKIHYGLFGSSNAVIRDAVKRDALRDKHGIVCMEMEAAAIMDLLPCLVIRGICDYGDSHKNKDWQPYAAAVAAGYTKDFLRTIPPRSPIATSRCDTNVREPSVTVTLPKVDELLESLKFNRMDDRLYNIMDPMPLTCRWMANHQTFRTWADATLLNNHNGFMWIKGKPGTGKSTIMKTILQWEKRHRPDRVTTHYFFNARAPGDLEKSSVGLYRSLCYQLLLGFPRIQQIFVEYFRNKNNTGVVDDWTANELQSFLNYIVEEHLQTPFTILIDALDEGDIGDIRQLVEFLEDFSIRASSAGLHLRICLSSRHYPHISIKTGLELVLEDQAGHNDDIRKYVTKKLPYGRSGAMEGLRDRVCQKSASIFLWVVLVIPILATVHDEGGSIDAMLNCLTSIPAELDGLFANILGRNTKQIQNCLTLLQWVLYSFRALSAMELCIAIDADSYSEDFEDTNATSARIHLYLRNTSRGLIEMSKSNPPTVQFIHETVREFLRRSSGLQRIDSALAHNLEGTCHDRLKTICFSYLQVYASRLLDKFEKDQTPDARPIKKLKSEVSPRTSFMQYCADYMFEHADAAEAGEIPQSVFLQNFHAENRDGRDIWIRVRNAFQHYKVREYTMNAPILYILAHRGLLHLFRVLNTEHLHDSRTNERYGYGLQAACVEGHETMALELIQAGSEVNARGGEWHNALFAAIRHKHMSTARMLIEKGARPPIEIVKPFLFETIARGHLPGVELLFDLGALWNEPFGWKGTPLTYATKKHQVHVVACLLGKITDINHRAETLDNLLVFASSAHQWEVVQLLIEKGADSNAQGGLYGNALQAASFWGSGKTVQLLLDAGAEVNAQGGLYGNALQAAASRKDLEEIVQLLLDAGADVNAQGGVYGNALQAASYGVSEKIVQPLLDAGADVNAQGGVYGTALKAASERGSEKIVQLLLDAGADINAQGCYYGTALQAASERGLEKIVQLLLDEGADVNA